MSLAAQLVMRDSGAQSIRSYAPSTIDIDVSLAEALGDGPSLDDAIPIPMGAELNHPQCKRRLQL